MDFTKFTIDEAREFLAYNGVQETSLDTRTVQTRAFQLFNERSPTGNVVYSLIFLAMDRAARFPSTNKYTESQVVNMTPEQMQLFGRYYQFDSTQAYAKPFLWRVLQLQGNALPPVQSVVQPIVQQYVPQSVVPAVQQPIIPVPVNITNAEYEYRKRIDDVFSDVPIGIVRDFIRLNSGGFNIKFDKTVTDDYIYKTAVDLYIKSVKNTGTIKDGGSLDIKAIHAAISKPNPNKYTEDQLRNLTNQQIDTFLAYYGLEDLKKQRYDRSSLINTLYIVLKYQDNIIEAEYVAPVVQQPVVPVVQPNLINFNTVNPLVPAPAPTINPLINPVVMSPVKQLSPIQPLQLSPRPGPSVFTDVKMSPVKQLSPNQLSANRPMSPQQTSQQMVIGPQSYTSEFAKIKNAEDDLRRHYAEHAFANPRRYDASNPTYNLMDVTDKADTYINAYKPIQRSNYVTADSIFASYAFSAIKEANLANNTPDFRNKFVTMMNSLIPENLKKNLVIAGGFVLSYFGVSLKNNDIDIFIVGTDQPELILTQYMDWLTKETTFVLGRRSPFAVTIFRKDDMKRPISIILRQYKSPSEIMTGFDLDASCFCFYNGRVWTSARGDYALRNRTNTVDVDRLSPSYNYRLLKYGLSKGFRAVVPGLKKTEAMARNIERNLSDDKKKAFGCVGLYALLRMEVLKNIDPNRFYTNIGEVSDYDVNMRDAIYGDYKNKLKDVIRSRIHPDFKDDDQSMYFERIETEDRDTKAIYYTKDPILLLQDNKLIGKVLSNKPVFIKENPGKQGYYTSSFHPIQTTWVEWSDLNNCVPAALNANGTVDMGSTSFKKFALIPEGH